MPLHQRFTKEFSYITYIVNHGKRFLLVAHKRPDPDTVGAVLAFKEFLLSQNKHVDIACYDPFPQFAKELFDDVFLDPDELELSKYDVVIGCDSVERGFHLIARRLNDNQATILLDHHHDVTLMGDVTINDPESSSTCEVIYKYFTHQQFHISQKMATPLLLGILGDTGNFQHACTTADVLEIGSDLLKKGAPLQKIVDIVSSNKNFMLLKLWGKAIERARVNPKNGMIYTALSQSDLKDIQLASEDVKKVASLLMTVPDAKFSLFAFQLKPDTIRCSLRSEEGRGVDVSSIAHTFGGGGHKLAAGFEIKGVIQSTKNGWKVA